MASANRVPPTAAPPSPLPPTVPLEPDRIQEGVLLLLDALSLSLLLLPVPLPLPRLLRVVEVAALTEAVAVEALLTLAVLTLSGGKGAL